MIIIILTWLFYIFSHNEDQTCSVFKFYKKLIIPGLQGYQLYRLDPIKIGNKRVIQVDHGRHLSMITRSFSPPIFTIDDMLTSSECDRLIQIGQLNAKVVRNIIIPYKRLDANNDSKLTLYEISYKILEQLGIKMSVKDIYAILQSYKVRLEKEGFDFYITKKGYYSAPLGQIYYYIRSVAGLNSSIFAHSWATPIRSFFSNKEFNPILKRIIKITNLPSKIVKNSVSPMVYMYGKYSSYGFHTDSPSLYYHRGRPCCQRRSFKEECVECRYMTIMVFLNSLKGGGYICFPLAGKERKVNITTFNTKMNKISQRHSCLKNGLFVFPKKGMAVVWYNHFMDEHGLLGYSDPASIHREYSFKNGDKWVFTNWITGLSKEQSKYV